MVILRTSEFMWPMERLSLYWHEVCAGQMSVRGSWRGRTLSALRSVWSPLHMQKEGDLPVQVRTPAQPTWKTGKENVDEKPRPIPRECK